MLVDFILGFSFYYPLFMAYFWMAGAIYYYFHWERKDAPYTDAPELDDYPPVSILVPCYNEEQHIVETAEALTNLDYPNYDIIAINDGSSDATDERLDALARKYDKIKAVHLSNNQGKAMALRAGAMLSDNELLLCIDGDAILDENCITWMVKHFIDNSRVGAVTGNPRIRNRTTLLGKMQVGEFSSIIGLIKRAQRVYGRIFTVSGVCALFRKSALHQIGYWSTNMITEDIDISWKLQTNHWGVHYEPNAMCWILMPETLRGLFNQRIRWAQGGAEVLLKYANVFSKWRKRRMWPVYLELLTSVIWSYVIMGTVLIWAIGQFFTLPSYLQVESLLPGWTGVMLGMTCLIQFGVSLFIDSKYEKRIKRYYFWVIWYPMVFWFIAAISAVVGLPKALLRNRKDNATWTSPDRGLKSLETSEESS